MYEPALVASTPILALLCRMFILGLWHACHATISLTVVIKANDVKRLLDPVSSGMVML